MTRKKIVFLTGTRADFGKIKSLIQVLNSDIFFDVHIFATGMHLNPKYGKTIHEIYKSGFKNIFPYFNHKDGDSMEEVVANTITGFSNYIKDIQPDLIIVHGDRSEALAGAIVGSFNNILVGHIEGGEESGTIDELIRHSVSKLSHIHFVANNQAKNNLMQMGENKDNIFIIGSPDIDIMKEATQLDLNIIKKYYNIPFNEYAIVIFHPVTTEYETFHQQTKSFVNSLLQTTDNFIIIYPNNDKGSEFIFDEYKRLKNRSNILLFPSLRFEYFLKLLSEAKYIIGNSSVGIREAPFYGVPTIDVGSRQRNRYIPGKIVKNCKIETELILSEIANMRVNFQKEISNHYGKGNSNILFYEILKNNNIFFTSKQKSFIKK